MSDKQQSLEWLKRRLSRREFAASSFIAASALGIDMSPAASSSYNVVTAQSEPGVLTIPYPNFPILDPQVVSYGMWFTAMALLEGLTTLDATSTKAVPGIAESWEISEDQLVYTFLLRDSALWSNGEPVTASDFEFAYRRLLTPETGGAGITTGANSYQVNMGIKGAKSFLEGTLTEFEQVGVKAADDRRLVITLDTPNPDFLIQLTHPSMLPMPRANLEQHPDDWGTPSAWIGNGPFIPEDWSVNASMTLVPNQYYWDPENVYLERVNVRFASSDTAAVTGTLAYENNEIDIVRLGPADIARYQNDSDLNSQLRRIPTAMVGYLALLRSQNPALDDVNVRRALAIGMDRDVLAQVAPDLQPALSLVPPTVPGYDGSGEVVHDLDVAKQLLADAGYPDGEGFPDVHIMNNDPEPVLEALVNVWQESLGINVKLDILESGVYVENRFNVQEADYIGFYYGDYFQLPTWASWTATAWGPDFTKQFSLNAEEWGEYQDTLNDQSLESIERASQLVAFVNEHASPEALRFETTVQQALAETDPTEQLRLFKEAARIRQETFLFIPIVYIDIYYAVKPSVQGLDLHQSLLAYYLKGVSNER